jgi:hypothetical protein
MMANIMPCQARRSDPLEMASLKATSSDCCGGHPGANVLDMSLISYPHTLALLVKGALIIVSIVRMQQYPL